MIGPARPVLALWSLAALVAADAMTSASSDGAAWAAPKPPTRGRYDLSILGFNDGEPFRLKGAEAESVLSDPEARVFQFQSTDWLARGQRGAWIAVAEVLGRLPERSPTELFKVYRLDIDGEQAPELLLVPTGLVAEVQLRIAPSMLKVEGDKMVPRWAATTLPGERFRVIDIRDLNGDLDPELVLGGEGGQAGYYQFMELAALAREGWVVLDVPHVDSLHFVDLDGDDRYEIVVRERVGRKGPAYQWTYIDHLYRWTGARFEPADALYPRYHDEQTLPTLIGDLIDNSDARLPILEEKLGAIQRVRELTATFSSAPRGFHQKKVRALNLVQKKQMRQARAKLDALDRAYPYDSQVLLGLAQARAPAADWEGVLDAALRALSVEPKNREAWWWTGVAFTELQERSSAVACMLLAVRLTGRRDEGVQFLRARRAVPGMDSELQGVIDQAIDLASKLD